MVEVMHQNGATIVELDERYDSLDDELLEDLSDVLLETASDPANSFLVLDLGKTRFIGSRFIGLLVRVWKRVQDHGGRMGLCCVPPFCRDALISTRLYDTLWKTYGTREEAISDTG